MSAAPVLDTEALARLEEQLGDADVLCRFLRRYVDMLDQRLERLDHALRAEDRAAWMDAALSLKASSSMACAQALAEHTAALQDDIAPCPAATAPEPSALHRRRQEMAWLRELAGETAGQLQGFLRQVSRPASPVS
jgi:HPt (histidine-containing phosphotransfer) domain-containing protein